MNLQQIISEESEHWRKQAEDFTYMISQAYMELMESVIKKHIPVFLHDDLEACKKWCELNKCTILTTPFDHDYIIIAGNVVGQIDKELVNGIWSFQYHERRNTSH